MDKYSGNDNSGKPKTDYLNRIATFTIEGLRKETKDKIWLSGYANNNPRSDYHWHVDACYDELMKRTGDDREYSACYKYVLNCIQQ